MANGAKHAWYKSLAFQPSLTHAEHRVLVTIAGYTDGDLNNAFPSLATLAAAAAVSAPTVKRAIKKLRACGWLILTEKGGNQNGKGATNVYSVRTPEQVEGVTQPPPPPPPKGVSQARQGGASEAREGGKPVAPQQILRSDQEQGAPPTPRTPAPPQPPAPHDTPPTTCPRHDGLRGHIPPCRDCALAKDLHRQWCDERRRAQAAAQSLDARQRAAERLAAARECPLCDEHGTHPSGFPCDHDPHRERRNRAGSALVREVLRQCAQRSQLQRACA